MQEQINLYHKNGLSFGFLFDKNREVPMPEILFQTQSNKLCAFCIRIKYSMEHNISHPTFCPEIKDVPASTRT